MKVTILRERELRDCVRIDIEVIEAIEDAFADLARGKAQVPPIVGIEVPDRRGELDIKTAYVEGLEHFAIKVASGFFDNEILGLPVASGMMILISTITGFPEAVLFDNGYLTQVRTAAAGAIAARYLANEGPLSAAVFGAGLQGRFQVIALDLVRELRTVSVFDLDSRRARKYAQDMSDLLGIPVRASSDPAAMVQACDVVITATPSRKPYFRSSWLHEGLHITAMGADMEEKQELDSDVASQVDLLCCDLKSQCLVRGETHHAVEAGHLSDEGQIIELGDLVLGRVKGRRSSTDVTLCDLTGVGIQDTAIATLAFERALSDQIGESIDI